MSLRLESSSPKRYVVDDLVTREEDGVLIDFNSVRATLVSRQH